MSNKLIRLWGSFDIGLDEFEIRRETYTISPPDDLSLVELNEVTVWFNKGKSAVSKQRMNKIRPILRVATNGSYECWCEGERVDEFIAEISNMMHKDIQDRITLAEKRFMKLNAFKTKSIKIYDKE